jgi:glucosamine kinase
MSVADGRAVAHALDLPRAQVADDQASTIAGALGDADGAVCAIGTGSFVGRQADGRVTRLGGWGFHLGDQASGAWLGRMLLTRACLAQDGILPASPLLTRVLAQDFGPGGHVAFQFRATPADYAALAPQVTGGDDPAARALLAEGAAYLTAALAALGWQQGQTLCLTGGVGPAYAALLPPSVPPRGNALDGALALAAREPAA